MLLHTVIAGLLVVVAFPGFSIPQPPSPRLAETPGVNQRIVLNSMHTHGVVLNATNTPLQNAIVLKLQYTTNPHLQNAHEVLLQNRNPTLLIHTILSLSQATNSL